MKTKKEKPFDFRTIKSFEDACKMVGVEPTALPDVSMIPEEIREFILFTYKLTIIYKAINNGWEPDYANTSQKKYYPWFWVHSSGSGFDSSDADCVFDFASTTVGSRLCTDTSEKARYVGRQFKTEYKAILLINK